MKKFWLLVISLIILSLNTQAQTTGYLETEGILKSMPKGQTADTYNQTGLYLACYLSQQDSNQVFGWYFWGLTNKDNWAESYGGLSWSPAEWLTLSAGIGLENADHPWRTNANVFISLKNISLLSVLEHGGSGFWYSNELVYNVKRQYGSFLMKGQFGLVARRNYGIGVILRMTVPYTTNLMVCGAIFYHDFELENSKKFSMSLRYNF